MRNWKYRLEFEGKKLRELINNSNSGKDKAEIVLYIRKCCEILMKKFEEDSDEYYDIEELYDLLNGDDEIILGDEDIIDYGFENTEELVDSRLYDFYSLCDDIDCWIGL